MNQRSRQGDDGRLPIAETGAGRGGAVTAADLIRLSQRARELEAQVEEHRRTEHALRAALGEREAALADLRQTLAEARSLVRLKTECFGTVSHSLRTPLNAVIGWARMVTTGQADETKLRRALEVIDRNAMLMLQMLDELIDVSSPAVIDADPVAGAPGLPPAAEPRRGASLLGEAHILVVDDDQEARDLLAHVLGEFGALVETATSASEAVRALSRQHFDMLLSDIGMPDRDGYALIAAVRHHPQAHVRQMPTVAVTGFTGDRPRAEALASGYDLYVTKPIDPTRFAPLLSELRRRGTPRD
jgi:CheY-like chemotaxis protein